MPREPTHHHFTRSRNDGITTRNRKHRRSTTSSPYARRHPSVQNGAATRRVPASERKKTPASSSVASAEDGQPSTADDEDSARLANDSHEALLIRDAGQTSSPGSSPGSAQAQDHSVPEGNTPPTDDCQARVDSEKEETSSISDQGRPEVHVQPRTGNETTSTDLNAIDESLDEPGYFRGSSAPLDDPPSPDLGSSGAEAPDEDYVVGCTSAVFRLALRPATPSTDAAGASSVESSAGDNPSSLALDRVVFAKHASESVESQEESFHIGTEAGALEAELVKQSGVDGPPEDMARTNGTLDLSLPEHDGQDTDDGAIAIALPPRSPASGPSRYTSPPPPPQKAAQFDDDDGPRLALAPNPIPPALTAPHTDSVLEPWDDQTSLAQRINTLRDRELDVLAILLFMPQSQLQTYSGAISRSTKYFKTPWFQDIKRIRLEAKATLGFTNFLIQCNATAEEARDSDAEQSSSEDEDSSGSSVELELPPPQPRLSRLRDITAYLLCGAEETPSGPSRRTAEAVSPPLLPYGVLG